MGKTETLKRKGLYGLVVIGLCAMMPMQSISSYAGWNHREGFYRFAAVPANGGFWRKVEDRWYYSDRNGDMQTGWIMDQGRWYYLNIIGVMQTGRIHFQNTWYYMNDDGAMATGWVQDRNGEWYFHEPSGAMLSNAITPDGYTVDSSGIWKQEIPQKKHSTGPGGAMNSSGRKPAGGGVPSSGGGSPGSSSGGSSKPGEGNKPAWETKPEEEGKPDPEDKPEEESKPNTGSKPDTGNKPEEESGPDIGNKPEEESKPDPEDKLEEESKPNTGSKPETGNKPEEESGPDIGNKPEEESKPNAENKPEESKPNSGSNPDLECKPDTEIRPDPENKPEEESKPEADNKPATPPNAEPSDAEDLLSQYLEKGLYLEANNQMLVNDFIDPKVAVEDKEIILVGLNFYPYSYKLNQNQYETVQSFTTKRERLKVNQTVYQIVIMTIEYQHRHDLKEERLPPSCTLEGMKIISCNSCDYRKQISLPPMKHTDEDGDFLCDRCVKVLSLCKVGDKQSIKTGLEEPYSVMTFTCIDNDYKGGMLFAADEVIPYQYAAQYGEDNQYTWSDLRQWLNFTFADELSVTENILPVQLPEAADGIRDKVFCLSKAEIRSGAYEDHMLKPWEAKEGTEFYWTRTADEDYENYAYLVKASGHIASQDVANMQTGVRPAYVLNKPNADAPIERLWMRGDVQERVIHGEEYIFRCIDEDYADMGSNRIGALFLCDSIIGGDIQIFDPESNTWDQSALRQWLHADDSQNTLADANTTIKSAYVGWTDTYDESLSISKFTKSPYKGADTQDKLFCLALEEAVRYQGDMWKLNGSDKNNFTQAGSYTSGFWLRTPDAASHTKTYCVTYDGKIQSSEVDNQRIGIRPAFVAPQ